MVREYMNICDVVAMVAVALALAWGQDQNGWNIQSGCSDANFTSRMRPLLPLGTAQQVVWLMQETFKVHSINFFLSSVESRPTFC